MERKLGIYIHIPFCVSKCSYCDFYSLCGQDDLMDSYERAVIRHIAESAPQLEDYYIDTVYFGGGTPSYFGAKRIANIFNALKTHTKVLKSSEVTVEMNPESITPEALHILRSEGVNRISMGIQSANDDILKLIGRRHNFRQAEAAVRTARNEGFDNISVDLIYGLPTQSKNDWAETLAKTIALHPQHISGYGLTIEDGTPISKYKNTEYLPTDDDQADMYLYMVDVLEQYGYPQYEISNFAMKGKESRHNIKYWRLRDYLGFGPGAHSCMGNLRYSYKKDINAYIKAMNGRDVEIIDECEQIGQLERAAEYIMLGMRTVRGISKKEYTNIYRSGFDGMEYLLTEYEKKGWTKKNGDRWRFTSSGFLLSNLLIGSLLEAQSDERKSANPWIRDDITGTELPIKSSVSGANLG